jgi:hypothetical protein
MHLIESNKFLPNYKVSARCNVAIKTYFVLNRPSALPPILFFIDQNSLLSSLNNEIARSHKAGVRSLGILLNIYSSGTKVLLVPGCFKITIGSNLLLFLSFPPVLLNR